MTAALRLFALLVYLMVPMHSHGQQAEMPAPASFNVGDTWEWRQVDNRTKLEEGKLHRTVVSVDGIIQFFNGFINTPMSVVLVNGGNAQSAKPWRVWPLEVGKKWTFDSDWRRPDGVTGNTKQEVEVVAFEEVDVPAGKFMAYKINHRGFYRNSNGSSGKQNDTFWYSPDAKADVKHMRDDGYNFYTRELVSYKRGTP